MRDRLESIAADTDGVFGYQESAALAQATRPASTDVTDPALVLDLLQRVYEPALVA